MTGTNKVENAKEADYYPEISFSKEVAAEQLREVEELVGQIRSYLRKNNIV